MDGLARKLIRSSRDSFLWRCPQLQMGKTVSVASSGTQFALVRPVTSPGCRDREPLVFIQEMYIDMYVDISSP